MTGPIKKFNANNESVESFNDSRSTYTYKDSASIDSDLQKYGKYDMKKTSYT